MKKISLYLSAILVIFFTIFLAVDKNNLSVFVPGNNVAQVPAVPTVTFSASPMTVTTGDSTTLSWSSTDATSCSLDLGINGTLTVGPSGTQVDTPIATKVYIIKCTGAGGSKNAKVTVTVNPPSANQPTVTLSASPASITTGGSSTLTWSSTNATSCSAPFTSSTATSGTQSVSPTSTTTYTMTCTGAGGSGSQASTVTVTSGTPAPTVTLSASPTSITTGSSSTLTWTSTNATSCSAPWTSSTSTSGTQSISPTSTTTYTMTCTGTGGSGSRNATLTVNSSGGGTVTLPSLPASINFSYPTVTGQSWIVNSGGNLQTALNQAQRGDEIVLEAGATFTGNFTLPAKTGTSANGWILIRSSKSNLLPAQGKRVSPVDASLMPKIMSDDAGAALATAASASGWWVSGVEITVDPTRTVNYGLVLLGDATAAQNSLSLVPSDIVLDRVYVHGGSITNLSRCVALNSARTVVQNSYLDECHFKGADAQAIGAWNGPGPFKILNNTLIGSGENIMFGGSDPKIKNLVSADIEILGNYIYTPIAWKGTLNNGTGQSLWTKKNLIEMKAADRVLIEGNVFDGSWADGQVGYALLFKSVNQGGTCLQCYSANITVRYNIIKNAGAGFNLSGREGSNPHPVGKLLEKVLIEQNIFENIGVPPYTGDGRLFQFLQNGNDMTIRNNTTSSWGALSSFLTVGTVTNTSITNLDFSDNILPTTTYGITSTGGPTGESNLTNGVSVGGVLNYSGNVAIGPAKSSLPTTIFKPDLASAEATGKGANRSAVLAATQYALNGGGTPPPPPSSPSLTFSASPASITTGASSTLTWSTTNVSSCTASNGWTGSKATSGTLSVTPTATTTYTLTCTGSSGGSVNRSAIVTVTSGTQNPTVTLSASPASVTTGVSSTLTWSTTNVTSCTASNGWTGSKVTSGTQSVTPTATTTYTLTCTGTSGNATQSTTVTVTAPPVPTLSITATPSSITSGQSSTLTWSATNATACTASGGWTGAKATSGTQSVAPTSTTTYSITCTGAGGSANQSVVVTVGVPAPTPTVVLSANPTSIATGASSVLTWSSVNATTCTASGGWTGTKATSGTQSVTPTATTTYTITCTGAGGNASQSVTVSVSTNNNLPTISISASPTTIFKGASSTLAWSATNATTCTASGGWTGTKTTSGSLVVSPTSNTTYTITCTGAGGSANQSVSVTVASPSNNLPVISFNATPSSVSPGGSAILTWAVQNANTCKASGAWSGNQSTTGNIKLSNIQTSSIYTLACIGSAGSSAESVTIKVSTSGPGGGGGSTTPPTPGQVCAQVITWAKSPTGTIQQFATPCNVPSGWTIVQGAGSGSPSISPITSYTFLVAGATNSQIAVLQDFLKNKGLFPATQASTGFFGNMTFQAVQSYQRSKGLNPDGKVGPITLAAINAELSGGTTSPVTVPVATPVSGTLYRTLYRGMYGSDVNYLQSLLKNKGYFQGTTSLFFGPITEASVKAFQAASGLKADGVVGAMSRAKILGN